MNCCSVFDKDVRELITLTKNKLSELAAEKIRELYYGYSCSNSTNSNIDKLDTYINILENHKKQTTLAQIYTYQDDKCNLVNDYKPCLDCDTLQCIIEKVRNIIGKSCKIKFEDLSVDDSLEEEWIKNNPTCLSYECWDKWARIKVREFGLQISSEEILEKLLIELSVESIKEEILVVSKVYDDSKTLNLKLSRKDDDQLKIELNLLLEKVPNAEIDLKLYRELYNHNLSFDIVREIYSHNLELEVAAEKETTEILLKTSVHKYPLRDIKIGLAVKDLPAELKDKYIKLLSTYNNG